MTVLRMCELGQVSRAGFYRFEPDRQRLDEDLDLRDEIQRIALEFPSYGRPRITAELKRRGWEAGHRRVGRILREDNLLCLRRRKFVVATTDSKHNLRVYPNLAGSMKLTGIDQLWIADITYIRLEMEFVYLRPPGLIPPPFRRLASSRPFPTKIGRMAEYRNTGNDQGLYRKPKVGG